VKQVEIKSIGEELAQQLESTEKVVVPYSRWKRWAKAGVIQDIADVGGICFSGKVGFDMTFFHYP
jgi:hypothetical protein